MPISEARVPTVHGSRYLQQLCKHWSHRFTVDFTAECGTFDFGDGRACALAADADALTLRATMPDGVDPARFEAVIADHLARFAFREELVFVWHRLGDPRGVLPETPASGGARSEAPGDDPTSRSPEGGTKPKPSILVFDVNETLLDIVSLEPLFRRLFGDAAVLREWFAQLVLYAQAATFADRYVPFGALGAGVLRMTGEIRGVPVTEADVAELKARTLAMPAHPDVLPALERLRDAGFRLVTLTNSAPDPDASPIERSGIARLVERQFSVDAVRRFKPAPEAYLQVSEALALPPDAFCMVAAHAWDTLGAQGLGWSGALVARPGNAALAVPGLPQPDVAAPDMGGLADAMIRRWR